MTDCIKVTVRSVVNDFGTKVLEFPSNGTVSDLRSQIAELISVDATSIRLILNASILNDNNVLLTKLPNITKDVVTFTLAKTHGKIFATPPTAPINSTQASDPRHTMPEDRSSNGSMSTLESDGSVLQATELPDPNSEHVTELVGMFSCTTHIAQLALALANNNVNLAATILSDNPSEEELEEGLHQLANPGHRLRPYNYSTEELEQLLRTNNFLEVFTTHISDWSPNLALRFNNDHDLLLDVFRLYLNMLNMRVSNEPIVLQRLTPDNQMEQQEQQMQLTPEDEDNIATIIGICGGDLNYDKVKAAYFRLGRDMNVIVSTIMDQREHFEGK